MARNKFYFIAAVAGIIIAVVAFRYFGTHSMQASGVKEAKHEEEGHEEEGHDEGEKVVRLHEEDLKEFGIEVKEAGQGTLTIQLELPGEITPNADRLAHIVPRAAGVVRSVFKSEGYGQDRRPPGGAR
jgi:hypothetical protein